MIDYIYEVEEIKKQLIEYYKPEKIILFGSVARNEVTENSDIDLLLIKMTDKSFTERIREAHQGLKYRIPLDIIVYTENEIKKLSSSSFFIRDIIEKGIILYEQ